MVLLLDFVYLLSYILIIPSVDSSMLPEPALSQECKRLRLCEDAPNYPTELASELIKELKNKTIIFADELDESIGDTNKAQYFDANEPKQHLCDSRVQYIAPRFAQNEDGKWDNILNQPNAIQRFRAEICSSPTEPKCNVNFVMGSESKCVQKFSRKKMYYIDDNEMISKRYYSVPTCCSCVLIYND